VCKFCDHSRRGDIWRNSSLGAKTLKSAICIRKDITRDATIVQLRFRSINDDGVWTSKLNKEGLSVRRA